MRYRATFASAAVLALCACGPATQQSGVTLTTPAPGARITTPLLAEGSAPNDWYFEAQFPAQLIGPDGAVIAEAPALARSDWQVAGEVPFGVEMAFSVDAETAATFVLQEDMPRDGERPRELRVRVVLAPTP